jgi:uncharacterized protein YicC (UPF0701 family)
MKIVETDISDIVVENIDESKIVLAEKIMKNVYPLFDEIYNSQIEETKDLKDILKSKKSQVFESKEKLERLMQKYNKGKKVMKLLTRISKLVSSGLVYDSSLKHETIILLKVADKLSEDKLNYHLSETMKTISKRFAQ